MDADARIILHVDMDAFYAAVELLDDPSLAGKPVIVGAPGNARGVVSTCNYEARKYGVHSAMPSRTAYSLCPKGIFLPVRMARYQEISRQVFAILGRYSPAVEPLSIDEAFLDVTGSAHLWGGGRATAEHLRAAIRHETGGLTASVGVAPNKFLAKLASDMNKPDGVTEAPRDPEAIRAFLAPLPLRRIWGVGPKTAESLKKLGLRAVADLQRLDAAALETVVGAHAAARLKRLCLGLDDRPVERDTEEKSISSEHTFDADVADWSLVERTLLRQADDVGRRLRAADRVARVAHLKLRWQGFETLTRQQQLPRPTHSDRLLREAGLALLAKARQGRLVRLVGFGVSHITDPTADDDAPSVQPDLFGETEAADQADERDDRLDQALDRIRRDFGKGSIKRGL